ncbi:MAG: hypothetical protein LBN40_00440 [Oscillospiraceae bacterium]|jgi:flagellin-like hook-associated protein FlgL|nr:hypothetical protein [Oscillospiraceae bacterium]
MRITNSTITRRYVHNLERSLESKNKSENIISTQKKFSRASQSPINAARAIKVRKAISEIDDQTTNLNTAKGIYEAAESAIMKVSELIQSTYEKLIYGANGTQSPTEDVIIGDTIKTYADEMLRLMNVTVADRTIFGGLSNDKMPYTMNDDIVYYNGKPVNGYQDPSLFPYSGTSYADIGIGMQNADGTYFQKKYEDVLGSNGQVIYNAHSYSFDYNGAVVGDYGLQVGKAQVQLDKVIDGENYIVNVSVGGVTNEISFSGGSTPEETVENMNNALQSATWVDPLSGEDKRPYFTSDGQLASPSDPYAEVIIVDAFDPSDIDESIGKYGSYKADRKLPVTLSTDIRPLTHVRIDAQSALPITFNGAEVLGCGYQAKMTEVNISAFQQGEEYSLDISVNKERQTIRFTGGADEQETADNINAAIKDMFGLGTAVAVQTPREVTDASGTRMVALINSTTPNTSITVEQTDWPKDGSIPSWISVPSDTFIEKPTGYSNNIIQLTIDAANCLKSGDKLGAAKYADALFAIQTNLSLAIAQIGNQEEFIDFNLDRLVNNRFTLLDQQNELEGADMGTEITNWKALEAAYNATLQLSAKTIPMSIFNFM